jgi:hypothetical protein
LNNILPTSLANRQQKLDNIAKLLDANSFERVLDRGFTLVTDAAGAPIKRAAAAPDQANVMIRFADGTRAGGFGCQCQCQWFGAVGQGDLKSGVKTKAKTGTKTSR